MSWTVVLTQRTQRDLRRIDRGAVDRIREALDRLAETGAGDVSRLQGARREWRLRVGDYRVRFIFQYAENQILVLRVLPRGRAYRD